jgi:hypothetical protein
VDPPQNTRKRSWCTTLKQLLCHRPRIKLFGGAHTRRKSIFAKAGERERERELTSVHEARGPTKQSFGPSTRKCEKCVFSPLKLLPSFCKNEQKFQTHVSKEINRQPEGKFLAKTLKNLNLLTCKKF